MNFSQLVLNKTASISKEEFKFHFKKTYNQQTNWSQVQHTPAKTNMEPGRFPLEKDNLLDNNPTTIFWSPYCFFLPRLDNPCLVLRNGLTSWQKKQLSNKDQFPRRNRNPPKITWTKQLCLNSIIYIPPSLPKTAHAKKEKVFKHQPKKALRAWNSPETKNTQFSSQNKGHEMSIIQILRNQWTQSRRDGIGNGSSGNLVATFQGSFRSNVLLYLFKLQLDSPKRHRIYVYMVYLPIWMVDFCGKCGKIYHTWILWVISLPMKHRPKWMFS